MAGTAVTCESGSIFTTVTRTGKLPTTWWPKPWVTCELGSTFTTITRTADSQDFDGRDRCDL